MSTKTILNRLGKWSVCSILALLVMSCNKDEKPAGIIPTDYSLPEHWLSLPANPDKPVDVFYLYPTCWTPDSLTNSIYCTVDNPSMLIGAAYVFSVQATTFESVGNDYAPGVN